MCLWCWVFIHKLNRMLELWIFYVGLCKMFEIKWMPGMPLRLRNRYRYKRLQRVVIKSCRTYYHHHCGSSSGCSDCHLSLQKAQKQEGKTCWNFTLIIWTSGRLWKSAWLKQEIYHKHKYYHSLIKLPISTNCCMCYLQRGQWSIILEHLAQRTKCPQGSITFDLLDA